VSELDYDAFDCDNHYYEALDAFTRHLDPALGPRCVQWCDIDGRKYHVVGGKVSRAVTNATFDPIAKAGAMHDYFRGNPDGKSPLEFLREREPIRPEYREPEARLRRMDEFGLEAIWLFPTLGVLYEELLKDDGVALLHSIGRMSPPGTTNPWLRKYIFPGGYTPALSETIAAIEQEGLWVTDVEILRIHYADTLREWRRRFQDNRAEVARLYDERFCRMWEFYLAGCEVAFRHMDQMVFQIQLAKRQDSVPLTRDYMLDWERAHMAA
jgi:hypothetical protein